MAFLPLTGQVMQPQGLQVVNEVLTNVARQFRPQGFIYDRLVAPQLVQYNYGLYPVFDPGQFFAAGSNTAVADRAQTPIVDFSWSTEPYACVDYRKQVIITRKELEQAHPSLRLDYSKTIGLLTQFASDREVRLAAKLKATANGGQFSANSGNALTPTVKWDQGTSSTPASIQADLQSAALLIMKSSGIRPNTVVMDYQVAYAIAADPGIKDFIKYTIGVEALGGGVDSILPSKLFGFNIVIADGSLYNTGRPGDSTTLTGVWGNSVRVMYVNPNAQWGVPSTVYAFRGRVGGTDAQPPAAVMTSGTGSSEPGPSGSWALVEQWWDMDPPAIHTRAWECVDERVVAPQLGIEIQNVLNSPTY
jgi:hypothetical protein